MLVLMTYIIPVFALIPVHGLVQLGSNAGRSFVQRDHVNWSVAGRFLAGALVGGIASFFFVVQIDETVLRIILGLFILIMIWAKLPKFKNPGLLPLGGALTTFASMFVGATGPLVAVFLNRLFDDHKTIVATHGMTMTVQHGLKLVVFGFAGFAFADWLPLIALMVLSGFAGTKAGTYFMNKTPESALKWLFKIVLTVSALDLLRRGLFA